MKQLLFTTFSIILVVQVFLGSTGVIVYEHHCKKDGTSRSFFVAQDHKRDQVQEAKRCDKSSCCSNKNEISKDLPFLQEESCCTNSTEFIHLDSDLAVDNNDNNIDVTSVALIEDVNIEISALAVLQIADYRGPPPLITSRRLARLQSYLI